MPKFRIKTGAGKHHENGKSYRAGEEFKCDRELDKLFPEKFVRVGGRQATKIDDGGSDTVTLKAVNRGRGQWDVVKVIDGELTDQNVNEGFVNKKEADRLVKKGI